MPKIILRCNYLKNDPGQSLQMIERRLMTPDELKAMPKGNFVVSKTGTHPMKTRLKLFLKWGITFEEPYEISEKSAGKVSYADKQEIEEEIVRRNMCLMEDEEEEPEISRNMSGGGIQQTPVIEQVRKIRKSLRTEEVSHTEKYMKRSCLTEPLQFICI